MEARNYRTLAAREPVIVPAVDAWRRSARRRGEARKAIALVTTGPFAVMGVLAFATGYCVAHPDDLQERKQ